MKKTKLQNLLIITIVLSIAFSMTAFAASPNSSDFAPSIEASASSMSENYSETDRIPTEAIELVLQRHNSDNDMVLPQSVGDNGVTEEISSLFAELSKAVMEGKPADVIESIHDQLEGCGVYKLSNSDMKILFPNTLGSGLPSTPSDTSFVDFWINSGTTTSGTPYVNFYAQSKYAPEDGQYQQQSLPLYSCKQLNIYPSRTDYTRAFLQKSLTLLASSAVPASPKSIPGILLSNFGGIAIDEFFVTGQSFGASAYGVISQTVVFSYLADIPDYYSHYLTAEQCGVMVVYYFASSLGGINDAYMARNHVIFSSANFSSPHNKAQSNLNSGNYLKEYCYCGTIRLTYPLLEETSTGATTATVSLPRQDYPELSSVPGA